MVNPSYVFDNFVSAASNRFARAACLTFARSTDSPHNPLFLYGPTGVGKTHLLHAIGDQVRNLRPSAKVTLATSEQMLNELCGALGAQMGRLRDKYASADLLLVDDIHIMAGKVKTQEELLGIFERLIANGGRLAMASSQPPTDMPILSDAIKSRMKRGLVVPIKTPSRHEVELILSRRLAEAVPPVTKNYIRMASECGIGSDVRRAEGIVKQMVFADSQVASELK